MFTQELFELVQDYIPSFLAVAKTQEIEQIRNTKNWRENTY